MSVCVAEQNLYCQVNDHVCKVDGRLAVDRGSDGFLRGGSTAFHRLVEYNEGFSVGLFGTPVYRGSCKNDCTRFV